MPDIITDRRDSFRQIFYQTDRNIEANLDRVAQSISQRFFLAIMRRQPDGSLNPDPLRDERPSVRQGLIPIYRGWGGGPRIEQVEPMSRDIVLKSKSEHVQYFTTMMGRRQYLGTRNSSGIDARKAPFLHFWWLGREWFLKHVDHHGFTPESDFVQDSWNETEQFAREEVLGFARMMLIQSVQES
jgi:hypothetical protein